MKLIIPKGTYSYSPSSVCFLKIHLQVGFRGGEEGRSSRRHWEQELQGSTWR